MSVTERYLAHNSQEGTYRSSWDTLKRMDRLVLQYIILRGGVGLYTAEARAYLIEQPGLETPLQNAVNGFVEAAISHRLPRGNTSSPPISKNSPLLGKIRCLPLFKPAIPHKRMNRHCRALG